MEKIAAAAISGGDAALPADILIRQMTVCVSTYLAKG